MGKLLRRHGKARSLAMRTGSTCTMFIVDVYLILNPLSIDNRHSLGSNVHGITPVLSNHPSTTQLVTADSVKHNVIRYMTDTLFTCEVS